jgi:hypothetical protein
MCRLLKDFPSQPAASVAQQTPRFFLLFARSFAALRAERMGWLSLKISPNDKPHQEDGVEWIFRLTT